MSCPDCFDGHAHDGTPKGQVESLYGLDTYVAKPAEGKAIKGIIVIISDAFGMPFVNNKLLADNYAAKGDYLVYLPDFMKGKSAPIEALDVIKGFSTGPFYSKPYYLAKMLAVMLPWKNANDFPKSMPIVKDFFTSVRQNEGAHLPIGAAGFCWGGKHTVNLAHGLATPDGKPLIDAGFSGHPSNLEIPGELEKMVKPVSFALGDNDSVVKGEQVNQLRQAVERVSEKHGGELQMYPGAGHGFCVRADFTEKDAESRAAKAEDQAIGWFQRHFEGVSY